MASLAELQSQLDASKLGLPRHVKTPTGAWNFFKDFTFPENTEERAEIHVKSMDGITVKNFSELDQEEIERVMNVVAKDLDTHTATHYKRITGGLFLTIGKPVEEPVTLTHTFSTGASYRNVFILAAAGAEATIIEEFTGDAFFISSIVEIVAEENSHITYAQLQSLGSGTLLSRKSARTARDASVAWFELNGNKEATFSRVQTELAGMNSETKNLSIYLGKGDNLIDFGAHALHVGEQTTSNLLTKGVLGEQSKAIYEGVLDIGEAAAKSNAFQEENCLLMSKDAEVKASPMLYINNNDVKCSHAATAGHIDKEKLFYLQARGLDRESAHRLLVKAFVWPVLEQLPEHSLRAIAERVGRVIAAYTGGEFDE